MTDGRVRARRGFFPVVTGGAVSVEQAGAAVLASRSRMDLTQAGAHAVLSRGDTTIHQGGATLLASGGDVSITQGGALVAAARSIRAEHSYIGVALAPSVDTTGATILFGPREAVLFGAVVGGVVTFMLRRFRR